MKKFASLLLALVMCLCCLTTAALAERAPVAKDDLKIGFIFLHDENSTYDLNFIDCGEGCLREAGHRRTINQDQHPRRSGMLRRTLLSWRTQAATSSSPTPSVMSPT